MKRNMLTLLLALLTALLLAVSVSAAEYGVIYTETDCLQSEELTLMGETVLPDFTKTYGIDLRVDVLTDIGDHASLADVAPLIYESYEYGCGEGMNGMTLTLLVREEEDGVALEDWYVYAYGDIDGLTTDGVWTVVPALNEILTAECFSSDEEDDSLMLSYAAFAMADALTQFVEKSSATDSVGTPESIPTVGAAPTPESAPDSFPAAGEAIGYVTDTAGIMTYEERQALEQAAAAVSEKHDFGVYIITADSFRDITDSYDVFDGATTLYNKYDLGLGEERKGVLLLLSMNGRDYSLITYSDYGNFVFDEDTREGMTYDFLDDFADDEWYDGFADYLEMCDDRLEDGPDKLHSDIRAKTGIIFLVPLAVAVFVNLILGARMKSVFKATEAEAYAGEGLVLSQSYDRFTHATETRRKRKSESSSGGGGGGRSRSSGGFGGTSGKF